MDSADPRDPIEVANVYNKWLRTIAAGEITGLRVIYDSISDFICFSDPQLAAQFLKQNLVWESINGVASLYVYSRGVPGSGVGAQVDQRFMEWNANSEIELTYTSENQPYLLVSGVYDEKRGAEIQWSEEKHDWVLTDPTKAFKTATLAKLESSGGSTPSG